MEMFESIDLIFLEEFGNVQTKRQTDGRTDVLTATTSDPGISLKHSDLVFGTKYTSELHEKSVQRSELVLWEWLKMVISQ